MLHLWFIYNHASNVSQLDECSWLDQDKEQLCQRQLRVPQTCNSAISKISDHEHKVSIINLEMGFLLHVVVEAEGLHKTCLGWLHAMHASTDVGANSLSP